MYQESYNTNIQRANSVLTGSGVVPQLLVSLSTVVVLYIVLMSIEFLYTYINRLNLYRKPLLPNTYATDGASKTLIQNPNIPGAVTVALSDNERTGPEYTYTFFLYMNSANFATGQAKLKHIFHKGVPGQIPLMNPGVYMREDTNALRIYMNTYKTWNTYVDIENFPVDKWVHVAVVCKASHGEIYVNGNLAKKLPFEGYPPYMNYGNIYCFSQRIIQKSHTIIPSTDAGGFNVSGAAKGFISRLTYFSYALGYTEIESMMSEGPSKKMDTSDMALPPYLADSWWIKNGSSA